MAPQSTSKPKSSKQVADEDALQAQQYDARGYALWVRSLQAKLLAARAQVVTGKADAILAEANAEAASKEFGEAFAKMEQHAALRPSQWALYSAYALYQFGREQCTSSGSFWTPDAMNNASSDSFQAPHALKNVLQLHERATAEGTGMDAAAHARYVSLLLHWHQAFTGLDMWRFFESVALGDTIMEEQEQNNSVPTPNVAAVDVLQEFTGLVGGPLLQSTETGAWTYVAPSLPVVPNQSEISVPSPAQAERVEEWAGDKPVYDILSELELCLGTNVVREQLWNAYARIANDAVNSQAIWLMYLSFEMAHFQANGNPEHRDRVLRLFRARAAVSHEQRAQTMSLLSTFVTSNYEPDQYESLMASAVSAGTAAVTHSERVRRHEDALRPIFATSAQPRGMNELSDDARARLARYLVLATDRTKPDLDNATILYRRFLALAGLPPTLTRSEQAPPTPEYEEARQAKSPETKAAAGAELDASFSAAEGIWEDYLSFLAVHSGASPQAEELDLYTQALRALPGSGSLWALLMRTQTRLWQPVEIVEGSFQTALTQGQVAKRGVVPLSTLLLGRCVAEKQLALVELAQTQSVVLSEAQLDGALETFARVEEVIQRALSLAKSPGGSSRARSASKPGSDPELRLERFYSSWCERFGPDMALLANDMWDEVANAQKSQCRAQIAAAEYYARTNQPDKARHLYKRGSTLVADDKTRLLDAWTSFEQIHGQIPDIEYALARSKRETQKVWEEYYATYQAQAQAQPLATQSRVQSYEPTFAASNETYPAATNGTEQEAEQSGAAAAVSAGSKRTADEAALGEPPLGALASATESPSINAAIEATRPKPKMADPTTTPDRENTSIVVSSTEVEPAPSANELRGLFQGCGTIAEVVRPRMLSSGHWAGLVVFSDRSSVPTALTRDKKRIAASSGTTSEVHVAVSRDCTLYVTNFPDSYTDADIRSLFGASGDVLDTRWPSRRFSSSRRFCYVEMATAAAANQSLSLNGRQLTELNHLTVALSDPERRKVRSDANASEREVYLANLPRKSSVDEIRELLAKHGELLAVRVPRPGIAFGDFRTPLDAHKAQAQLDGMEVQGRAIKASMADPSKKAHQPLRSCQGFRSRALHVSGLPSDAQEALVQQSFEHLVGADAVRQVKYTIGSTTAIVEMATPQVAGQVLLAPNVVYGEKQLTVSSLEQSRSGAGRPGAYPSNSARPAPKTATGFAPRSTRARPAVSRQQFPEASHHPTETGDSMDVDAPSATPASAAPTTSAAAPASNGSAPARKGNQDKFRALLG